MRRLPPPWTVALFAAGCGAVVAVTPALRSEMAAAPDALAAGGFLVLGQFELHTAGRATIVVKNRARVLDVRLPDDSTFVATVLGAQVSGLYDTLRLTFKESTLAGGTYTLRAINDTPLGGSIPVGIVGYQYVPCAHNFGIECDQPIGSGAREDQQVRLGMLK